MMRMIRFFGKSSAKYVSLLVLLMGSLAGANPAPRTFTDTFGNRVIFSGPVERVVSLAPNVTESVFAMGAGNRLVGVTNYCNYPPEAKALTRVGGIIDFDFEKIVALKPDLVLAVARSGLKI
jgi:iron complex transport system substrate-binding protein